MEGVSAGAELGALATRHVSHPQTPRSTRNGVSAEARAQTEFGHEGEALDLITFVKIETGSNLL